MKLYGRENYKGDIEKTLSIRDKDEIQVNIWRLKLNI